MLTLLRWTSRNSWSASQYVLVFMMMLGTDKQPYVYGYELDQAWAKCLRVGPKT